MNMGSSIKFLVVPLIRKDRLVKFDVDRNFKY